MVESFDIHSFIQNVTILSCHCQNSPFIDTEYGHIFTADLRILPNDKLGKLITKGPKYIKSSTMCRDKAKPSTAHGMNGAIKGLSNKFGINKLQFFEWKNTVLSHINFQINNYKNKLQHKKYKPFLNNTFVKEAFEKFQHNPSCHNW